jgi:uncharacterized protein YraI
MQKLARFGWILLLAALIVPVSAQQTNSSFPAPHYATEETFALIAVPRANLRSAPNVETGRIFAIVVLGDRYRIVNVTEARDWYQIEYGSSRGWISADVILVANPDTVNAVAETNDEFQRNVDAQIAYFQNTIGVRGALSIRSGPGTTFGRRGVIPASGRVTILGRNGFGTWFFVDYNGIQGWVSGAYLLFPPGYTFDRIPQR